MNQRSQDTYLNDWKQRQELAERMLPLIGTLYRDHGVVLRVYGRPLINVSTIDILKAHRFVKQYEPEGLSIHNSFPVLEALTKLDLSPARLDLGKLTTGYLKEADEDTSIEDYLKRRLADIIGKGKDLLDEPQDVVLYGFGRIGRLLARLLIEKTGGGNDLRLRAIVVRKGKGHDLDKRASLLRRDSVHGPFHGTIHVVDEENAIIANGNVIQVIYADAPDTIDYTQYGIDERPVIDNTGKWRDAEGLGQHLKAKGVEQGPAHRSGQGRLPNIVYGVNHDEIDAGRPDHLRGLLHHQRHRPGAEGHQRRFGILRGHVETVHSYTNDQNLIDNYHKAARRGRSAPLNMVLTETGAAKAVAKALPELRASSPATPSACPRPTSPWPS